MFNEAPVVTNPFPGLRPFEPHEYHLFFGRDGQSDELLRRLRQNRFVAVVGTSGSGKSSLVRAGLLPALHGGFMVSAGSGWRVTIFRPGGNPIGNMAEALSREDVLGLAAGRDPAIQRALVETTLRRGALGLADAVRQAHLPAGENLLVIVDQFEEIFRFKHTLAAEHAADDAAAFVKLLLEATDQQDVPVYVIITMRSDFLGDCAQFRDLPEAINDGQYLIPRMTRDQRREAITGPVAVGGAEIAPRLINRLLNDVGDNPDQLPILQHALMRTWQQWTHEGGRTGPLDLAHYEAIGGMAEALSRHADKAYDELPDERSKTIAEKLFKLLTERGGDNREIRRPTRLREICAVAEASAAEASAVIERFRREGRSFLMPPASVALHADSLIDISHESLIRGWQRLEKWVDDEASSARIFRRLAETAALYRAAEAGLWRDPDLALALRWRERNHPNDAWGARYSPDFDGAMEFLEASQRAQVAKLAERNRQRKKTLHLTQALAAVLLIGCLVSLASMVYAFRRQREADSATQVAITQANIAKTERAKAEEQTLLAETERQKTETERQKAVAAQAEETLAKHAAEEAFRRADESRLLAVRAKDEAQRSAAQARAAQLVAEEQRQRAEQQQQRAEQNARRASRLANRVIGQDIDINQKVLSMTRRIAQFSTPQEKAYWHSIRANARSNLKQHELAINELNEALKIDDNDSSALVSRSYMHLLTNPPEPEKAIADARKAIRISPSNIAAPTNLIIALGSLGRYDEAAQSLQQSIDSFTHSGYGHNTETEVAPEIEAATGQTILLADDDEELTALNYERATLAAGSGQGFQAALKEAEQRPPSLDAYLAALNWTWLHGRLNPNDYGVLAAQGALWAHAGFPREAAKAYAEFKRKHEEKRDPRYDDLARWVRQLKSALPAAPVATSAVRPDAHALALYARQAWIRGRREDARALFNQAAEASPEDIDVQMKRAEFLYNDEDFDSARAQYKHILQFAPRNATALLYYALAGFRSQAKMSPDDIRQYIREARKLDPTIVPNPDDLSEEIAKLLAAKSLDEAVDFLDRGARYNAPAPEPYFVMAKLLNDAGQHARALEKISLAIEMKGDQPEYYELRARAEQGLHAALQVRGGPQSGPARDEAGRTKALDFAEAGDYALLKFSNADAALNDYGNSLKALDELAKKQGVESVQCEALMILRKISKIAVGRFTRAEAAEYLQAMYGDLKGIEGLVKEEIKRLSHPG